MAQADPDRTGNIDKRPGEPSYRQLARKLAQCIVTGQWPAGRRIPQERELVRQYGLSRFTVRSALDVLESQGLIQRVRGKGTFVTGGLVGRRWFSTASTLQFVYVGATPAAPLPAGYYGGILEGARQMARTVGMQVQVHALRSYVHVSLEEYKPPQPAQTAGVLVCGTLDEQYLSMFASEGVPAVSVDLWSHDRSVDSVVVDVESDAWMAAEHLAEKGHTRVGFVATGRRERGREISEYDPDIWRLLDGWRRIIRRRGIETRDEWICLPIKSRTEPYQSVFELFRQRERPTALLCFDDGVAGPALRAIQDTGLRCPEDVSLVSRGIEEDADERFTRLVSDPHMLGRLAVKLLLERIQGQRQQAVKVAVATRLVLGKTTGPAPRK